MSELLTESEEAELIELVSEMPEEIAEALVSLLIRKGETVEDGETNVARAIAFTKANPDTVTAVIVAVLARGQIMEALGLW